MICSRIRFTKLCNCQLLLLNYDDSNIFIFVISVSPTARDRIVQISGQTKENINVAKNLIDATIKQNVSPIPFNEHVDCENNYPQNDNLYSACEYMPNAAKFSFQSRANSESDSIGHSIKLKLSDKLANIVVSDKSIGQYLEEFLAKYKFMEFIKANQRVEKPIDASGDLMAAYQEEKPQIYLTYDREFLLKIKALNIKSSPRVIEDIKMRQKHLYRS